MIKLCCSSIVPQAVGSHLLPYEVSYFIWMLASFLVYLAKFKHLKGKYTCALLQMFPQLENCPNLLNLKTQAKFEIEPSHVSQYKPCLLKSIILYTIQYSIFIYRSEINVIAQQLKFYIASFESQSTPLCKIRS